MDTQKTSGQFNCRRDFVTNSNMFAYPDSETSDISINSTGLRKIHDTNSEKCTILESNIKHLKRQHQLDLKAKDEIISKLKLDLEAANIINQAENENAERAANCMSENRNLSMHSRQKALADIYSLETKCFQLKLERLTLEFERQQIESGNVLAKLNSDVMALQEKINETNNLKQSIIDATSELIDTKLKKHISPIEQGNCITSQLSAAKNKDDYNISLRHSTTPADIYMNNDLDTGDDWKTMLRGILVLIEGLDKNTCNTDKLFNLLCLYGDVIWIHIIEREGSAVVKMDDPVAAERCFLYLNNARVGSTGLLKIMRYDTYIISKEAYLPLSDGSPYYKKYINHESRCRQKKHRIVPPTKDLFFYFATPRIRRADLRKLMNSQDVKPTNVTVVNGKGYGFIRFANKGDAILAVMKCNNMPTDRGSRLPLMLNFSET